MPTLAGNKQLFSSISSLIGCAFSIFQPKMDGLNPSETDIKVFFPASWFCLHSKKVYSIIGRRKTIALVREVK